MWGMLRISHHCICSHVLLSNVWVWELLAFPNIDWTVLNRRNTWNEYVKIPPLTVRIILQSANHKDSYWTLAERGFVRLPLREAKMLDKHSQSKKGRLWGAVLKFVPDREKGAKIGTRSLPGLSPSPAVDLLHHREVYFTTFTLILTGLKAKGRKEGQERGEEEMCWYVCAVKKGSRNLLEHVCQCSKAPPDTRVWQGRHS